MRTRKQPTFWLSWQRLLLILLPLLSLLTLSGTLIVWAASEEPAVQVEVTGQVLDEQDRPLANEPVTILFRTSLQGWDEGVELITDSYGMFQLNESLIQTPYLRDGRYCAEIQVAIQLEDYVLSLDYQPGSPEEVSEPGAQERWLEPGNQRGSYHVLLYHLRRSEPEAEEPDFADLTIQIGSKAEPCRFQLTRDIEIEAAVLQVNHLGAETGEAVADEETLLFPDPEESELVAEPCRIDGLAPLWVALNDERVAEAWRGGPIGQITVAAQPGTQQLMYYYHLDRDGDGVPDFQVTERFHQQIEDEGMVTIPGQKDLVSIYANLDFYQGQPPDWEGYRYLGYLCGEDDDLKPGTPEQIITADLEVIYLYEQEADGSNGGDNGNSGGNSGKGSGNHEEPPPDETKETPPPPEMPEEEWTEEIEELAPPAPEPEPLDPESEPAPDTTIVPDPVPASTDQIEPLEPNRGQVREAAAIPALTEEEREALRNITFTKRGHSEQAAPGEEVAYTFSGFENGFPYPLTEFTIVDRPDKGLDLVALELPAFRNGAGVTYQVTYTTNQQGERILYPYHPANQPLVVMPPELGPGEYLTELCIFMAEVPPGFGVGDQIHTIFRIWDEPPQEELCNRGVLFYQDQGDPVESQSEETNPALLVASFFKRWGNGPQLSDGGSSGTLTGRGTHRTATNATWLTSVFVAVLVAGTMAIKQTRRKV